MKIIKQGEIKPKEAKKVCGKCKTKFTYNNTDIKNDRDGSYINCPTCKDFIAVNYLA